MTQGPSQAVRGYADQLEETIRQRGPISAYALATFVPPPPSLLSQSSTPSRIKLVADDLYPTLGWLYREGRVGLAPGPNAGLSNPTMARRLARWTVLGEPTIPKGMKDPTSTGDTPDDEPPAQERRRWR